MLKCNNVELGEVETIIKVINEADSIVVTAHEFPDGDAVGSALAFSMFLRQIGKKVQLVLPLRQVGIGSILDGFETIIDTEDFDFQQMPSLLCCLDCSEPSRICDRRFMQWVTICPTINIDHHGKQLFGKWNYVVKDYSSTGELIYNLAQYADWKMDRTIAEALWMALVTDTNRFSKPACNADTLKCAAALASCGARVALLNDLIYAQDPWNNVQLRKHVYNSLRLLCNGEVALASLECNDFKETNCVKQDAAEFPLIPFGIKGVKLAALIYLPPDSPTKVRISLRSRPGKLPSAKLIAEYFGGSGHDDSAGAAVENSTVEKVCEEFTAHIEEIYRRLETEESR